MLDAAYVDRLHGLATAVAARIPEVADRLLDEIARATVVSSGELPSDVVTIGSDVIFRDDVTGAMQAVTLVLPHDADISQRRVSVVTPIGAALIGLAEGASIGWQTPAGERRRLTVLAVAGGRR
jgi:regulator of nucleoside diphosphate kinase